MKIALTLAATAALTWTSPALAQDWHPFSSNSQRAYLADVTSIVTEGDVTTMQVAVVPRTGAAGDYSHRINHMTFRCGPGQIRTALTVEYDASGIETDRYQDAEEPWDDIVPNSYSAFVKEIACDGARASSRTWPSVTAYVDAGRN